MYFGTIRLWYTDWFNVSFSKISSDRLPRATWPHLSDEQGQAEQESKLTLKSSLLYCFDNPSEFEGKRKRDYQRILLLTGGKGQNISKWEVQKIQV